MFKNIITHKKNQLFGNKTVAELASKAIVVRGVGGDGVAWDGEGQGNTSLKIFCLLGTAFSRIFKACL